MRHQIRLTSLKLLCSLVALCFHLSLIVAAQTVETVHKFETEPHVGTPEEALVGIIVTNRADDGSVQVRHGNGVFIRCDGFIMAPEALFSLVNTAGAKPGKPNQSVTVVLHPGTDHEKRLAAQRPRDSGILSVGDRWYKLTYAVFKMDDIHNPAPRLLSPDALVQGDPLRILSSAWSEPAGRFQPPQVVAAAFGAKPMPALALLPNAASPTAPIQLFSAQISRLSELVPMVPDGAIVVGPDNMVVGIVTEANKGASDMGASSFANLGSLDQVTNCVGLLPSTDKQFTDLLSRLAKGEDPAQTVGSGLLPNINPQPQQPLRAHSDMVAVPGGPLKVATVLQSYDPEMENVYDACIPSFQIDRYEVTNAQYLEFWQSLSVTMRKDSHTRATMYPYAWGPENRPFPGELAQVPVLGVRLAGAKAYAKWAGKRLPTPYEWCLAAFGRFGGNHPPEWADKYMKARADAWDRIIEAHIQYAHQHPEVIPGFTIRVDITGGRHVEPDWSRPVAEEFCQLPWFFMRQGYAAAAAWSHDCVKQMTDSLFRDWVDPGYVLPVGSRQYDTSPCGAQDMIMNARELVLPGPHGMWKKLPNDHWPYADIDRYMQVDWVQAGLFKQPWFRIGDGGYDLGLPHSSDNPFFVGNAEALVNIDALVKTMPMYNTNLLISHPAHNEPGNIATIIVNPGAPFTDSVLPITSIDSPVPAEADGNVLGLYHPVSTYEFRMPSRRMSSASQNLQAGFSGFVAADLGDYVTACGAVQEYSEVLRPVDTCMLNLVPGPTLELPYWSSIGTWGYGNTFQISLQAPARRVGRIILRGNSISDVGLNEWTADATNIGLTGAFGSWSRGPDHYHTEMGRAVAVDARYQINTRITNQTGPTGFAPDTFLIPGGFRCAR